MRIHIFLLLGFLCLSNCSNPGHSSETGANKDSTAQTSSVVANNNRNTGDIVKGQTVGREKLGDFRVDSYEDNELVRRSFFRNDLLVKAVAYDTQTKTQESQAEYFYTKDGKFDRAEVKRADGSKEADSEAGESARDFIVQNEILKSKGVEFPLPDIVADEVHDLSNVISVAGNYSDFKTESQSDGNRKVIKFVGFNKNIRFRPSTITLVVGGNPILIKDYELTLEGRYPSEEIYITDGGKLTKTYSYKDGKLIGVIYQFTDPENQTNSLAKRFEYHQIP